MFSLRTRIIFFSVVGTAAVAAAASFWLTSDQENAYWAYDLSPTLMQTLGPKLGVPIDPSTGQIDKNILGPRDIRDLVGEDKIDIEIVYKNGTKEVKQGLPMQPLHELISNAHNEFDRVRVVN